MGHIYYVNDLAALIAQVRPSLTLNLLRRCPSLLIMIRVIAGDG